MKFNYGCSSLEVSAGKAGAASWRQHNTSSRGIAPQSFCKTHRPGCSGLAAAYCCAHRGQGACAGGLGHRLGLGMRDKALLQALGAPAELQAAAADCTAQATLFPTAKLRVVCPRRKDWQAQIAAYSSSFAVNFSRVWRFEGPLVGCIKPLVSAATAVLAKCTQALLTRPQNNPKLKLQTQVFHHKPPVMLTR